MLSSAELERYKTEYNLAGQPDFLLEMNRHFGMEGQRILEVGGSNIPKPFIFEVLKARQWISVDRVYPENRQYWPKQYKHTGVIPLSEDIDYCTLDQHVILDGGIEMLPLSFAGRFDAIVSMDAFEHIPKFGTMLDRTYDALRPGGKMLSMYSPIWSSHCGHHLWGITDKAGKTYYIESSPIPTWGHLLMRPHEMYHYLLQHTDAETADKIVSHVYHSDVLNRLFYEDFEGYIARSRFEKFEIKKYIPDTIPDAETQKRLENLYPGRKNFHITGILLVCEKSPTASTGIHVESTKVRTAETFKLTSAVLFEGQQQPWRMTQPPWSQFRHEPADPVTENPYTRTPDGRIPEFPIKSMICPDEILFLYYLASHHYTGAGDIVDMGPLAGGSTYAIASGISRGHIHSYDLWQYFDGFEQYFGPTAKAMDLLEEFHRNLGDLFQKVTPHRGNILDQSWTGEPIEIMFIDAAKSPALMRHIANEFFPHLTLGAYVVHQDFVSAEDPWIHVAMGILGDHFETMDSPEGGSVCFRVTKPIPPNPLAANYFEGQEDKIRAARQMLPGWHGLCVELAEANYLALNGSATQAQAIVDAVRKHPLYQPWRYAYDEGLVKRAY